jgi:hypothetical protein
VHKRYIIDFRYRWYVLTHPDWLRLCRAATLDSGKRVAWFGYREWEMRTVWKR